MTLLTGDQRSIVALDDEHSEDPAIYLMLTCDRSTHHDPMHEADVHLTDTSGAPWCVTVTWWPTNHGPTEEENSAGIS